MSQTPINYPPLGFYFNVDFAEMAENDEEKPYSKAGLSFQSVSGLNAEVVTETYSEGGNNDYDYRLPVKTQYPPLVLKRGLWIRKKEKEKVASNDIQAWFRDMMSTRKVKARDLVISLLKASDKGNTPLMTWNVKGAWPLKWNVSDFNAQESQVVIETMELHYNSFTVNEKQK